MSQPPETARPGTDPGGFRLGKWTVHQAEGTLCSPERSLRLEPRVMDVLIHLASAPGKVISKEELLEAVWEGSIVEEGALSQVIHSLRKALGDDAHQPQYIQTIPKRGYRLLVPVVSGEAGPEAGDHTAKPSAGLRLTSERRQVTVVCCELVGTFDPETLHDLMLRLRGLADGVARRYDGQRESILGSQRLLICFGYPQAHEDNARRAVRAALELVDEVARMNAGADPERPIVLALRAGVHTGLAVVSVPPQDQEPMTLGATLDLAIALQSLAEPGRVIASPATCSLIEKSFALEALPAVQLPGLATPPIPCRVLQPFELPGDSPGVRTPLVGREREMELLLSRWALAHEGNGQVVLISGEAGIGKSRLALGLQECLEQGAAQWWSCFGSPYTKSSPLHLGQFNRARQRREDAMALARRLGFPFTLAFASIFGAGLAYYLRDAETVRRIAREVYDLAVKLGFSYWSWQAPLLLTWSQLVAPVGGSPAVELGDFDSVQRIIAENAGTSMAYYFCLHAEILFLRERPRDAWRALDEGLRFAEARGVSFWIEEIHRWQGEILLNGKSPEELGETGGPAEAEQRFQTALELARCNGSRSLMLRAALSLGRLWKSQGRTQAARELVAQTCQGFSGTSRDLREAGAFLDSCPIEDRNL